MNKTPVFLVACMLLFSSLSAQADNSSAPDKCCFKFCPEKDCKGLRKRVANIQQTHTQCPKDAYVITMKRGKKYCLDPSEKWAEEFISDVKNRTTTNA